MPYRFLVVVLVLSIGTLLRAEDWPQFRGPSGQGHAAGRLPGTWGPDTNVVWKQAIPGKGWSSPIVAGDRIFLTTAVPGDTREQSLQAICLESATGRPVWQQEVFHQSATTAPPIHRKNSHASPTPVFHAGRLYVHFGHQGTACLDRDGTVLWRNRNFSYQPVHGNGGSPAVVEDVLVFCADGSDTQRVIALDLATGRLRWQAERGVNPIKGFSFCTPLAISVAGRTQVVCPGSDVVTAHEPATGKEIWRIRYQGYSVVPRPVFGHGLLFVCTGYDKPKLIAIRPDGQGDVTKTHIVWTAQRGIPLNPSPLLVGDELYLISDIGMATCLDARTGKLLWQERVGGNFSASPLFADGKIYVQDEDGVGTVFRAGRRFERLARNVLEERTLASYAAADGNLYLRTEQHLYRIRESRSVLK